MSAKQSSIVNDERVPASRVMLGESEKHFLKENPDPNDAFVRIFKRNRFLITIRGYEKSPR